MRTSKSDYSHNFKSHYQGALGLSKVILAVALLLLILPLFYPILVIYSANPYIRENMDLLMNCIILSPFISFLVLIFFGFITEKTKGGLISIEENIHKLSPKMEKVITTREELEEIQKILKEIHRLILMFRKTLWWYYILGTRKDYILIKENLSFKNKLLLTWLKELKSDIEDHVLEQSSRLQGGKEALEKIYSTSYMNGIERIQSTRLDQQIQQFEDLQRVLVKL